MRTVSNSSATWRRTTRSCRLYRGLWASEHGHYRTFIQLAEEILPEKQVAKRWDEMLDDDARIIQAQADGPRLHSGAAL